MATTGRQQRIVAHEYVDVGDKEGKCLGNLATRLYVTKQAGKEDWKRWAKASGDEEVIAAVNEAVKAVEAAHQQITKAIRRKSGREQAE